jgi:protein-export membrane protein SecD
LVVELPGVTDLEEAIAMIGETPLLEFRLLDPNFDPATLPIEVDEEGNGVVNIDPSAGFLATDLTGRYLKRATLQFSQGVSQGGAGLGGEPVIGIQFDETGSDLFEQITTENTGQVLAIFLDGAPISTPVIQTAITGGEAVITGDFTPDEAKQLVGRLNSGALPVPITLLSTQTIGPSLGAEATEAGVMAGLFALLAIAIVLVGWYRLPGFVATITLAIYTIAMLALFKYIPVTLTAAGLTGFIISLGIAVDANILIFERMKEEMREGSTVHDSIKVGFKRAWASIRDANISSLISAAILFWFGTSLIQGFALTFGLGVLLSMITAISVTRVLLHTVAGKKDTKVKRALFGTGLKS